MSYLDTDRAAPFGASTVDRAASALRNVARRLRQWLGRRTDALDRLSPAELEDIGLSVADVQTPRRAFIGELADTLWARAARRETVSALSRLSDAQLDDIGLTRYDVEELRAGRIAL